MVKKLENAKPVPSLWTQTQAVTRLGGPAKFWAIDRIARVHVLVDVFGELGATKEKTKEKADKALNQIRQTKRLILHVRRGWCAFFYELEHYIGEREDAARNVAYRGSSIAAQMLIDEIIESGKTKITPDDYAFENVLREMGEPAIAPLKNALLRKRPKAVRELLEHALNGADAIAKMDPDALSQHRAPQNRGCGPGCLPLKPITFTRQGDKILPFSKKPEKEKA